MEEKFKNPKLQKLYEMLCELYPNRVFWQDIGEDNELIVLSVDIIDNFNDGTKVVDALWINAESMAMYPEHLPEQDTDDYIVFAFEN